MGSVELVKEVIDARKTWEHLEYRNKRGAVLRLDAYGLLTTRQIGDALGISHTAVQYHLRGEDRERNVRGGFIDWDYAHDILDWLRVGDEDLLGSLADEGSSKWALLHLQNHK